MTDLEGHFEFGGVLVQADLNTVIRDGEAIKVSPRVMDVLVYLVDHRNRVVAADELLDTFWAGRVVEESTVHRLISQIRSALGDSAGEQRFIKTVSKRGYQAVATVQLSSTVSSTIHATGEGELPDVTRTTGEPYVFICYSHRDVQTVHPEIEWLSAQGIKVWYDRGISAGANWRSTIGDALLGASHVLYFISKHSLASNHCNNEMNLAIDEGLTIIPVYLEEAELTPDLKVGLNRIQALFFSSATYRSDLKLSLDQGRIEENDEAERSAPPTASSTSRPSRLGRVAAVCAAVILLAAAGGYYFFPSKMEPIPPSSHAGHEHLETIAVLPFTNLSTDEELGFFGLGLTDVMLDRLAQSDVLNVAARTSTFQLAEQGLDLKSLAEELDVFYVVEGSVQSRGEEVRITVQLIRAVDGYHVWSKTYDRHWDDPLAMQQAVGQNAAAIAEQKIYIDGPREYPELYHRFAHVDPLAVKYFQDAQEQSVDLGFGEGGDLIHARQLVESAIAIDPDFSSAHADLAWHYMWRTDPSISAEVASQRAHAAIREVKRLNPEDEDVDFVLLQVYFSLDLNYAEAERMILKQMKAFPEGRWYPLMLAGIASREGRRADARRHITTAVARGLNAYGSEATVLVVGLARLLIQRGDLDEALEVTTEGLDLVHGGSPRAEILLMQARAFIRLGKTAEAQALVAEAWRLGGADMRSRFAPVYQLLGEDVRAQEILAGVTPQNRNRGDFVETYLAWGDEDKALALVREGIEGRDETILNEMRMPGFLDPIKDDPRFPELLRLLESIEKPTAKFLATTDREIAL